MSGIAARQATKAEFRKMPPQLVESGGKAKTWITRGGNFAVVVSEVEPGAVLSRANNPEEYMIILPPEGASATIEAGGRKVEAKPDSLTIVPPGASTLTATTKGLVARIFSKASDDIMAKASNAATYADGAPELAPPDLWPEPYDGYRLRHYPLAQYAKPDGDRIQPRVFRSTNMLVNLFVHYKSRRSTKALSPHWHDDFEQASLTLSGKWIHHMRYNWGSDLDTWTPDDHGEMGTPSVIIIPATVVHTSRDVGDGESSLYDIFCPPRMDFAAKKGFVINEDEYPLPATNAAATPGAPAPKTGGTLLSWQKPG
jgi:mannose-6-phosphate isomerase-like protein (cupin superfamily)